MGRNIDDDIARQQTRVVSLQGGDDVLRQCSPACAKFIHRIALRGLQQLRHLRRQSAAKMGRQLGRGDKIAAVLAADAQFGQAGGVIAQAWRVQRLVHKAVKRQPTARVLDDACQMRLHGLFYTLVHACIV